MAAPTGLRPSRLAWALVVPVEMKGYGSALMGGITAARGKFIVMRDADDSYDFTDLGPFVDRLGQDTSAIQRHRPEGRRRQTTPQTHPEPIEVPHLD